MPSLLVDLPDNKYNIIIEKGLLERVGTEARAVSNAKRVAIITDQNVDLHYGETVKNSFEAAGFNTFKLILEPGEKSKSMATLTPIYNALLDFGITRSDLIVALGGGVIGDVTGFAASTLLRGIPYIQIPTTLLAQVDSSVGGKVAVDLPKGKNLVGSFYHPRLVLIDPLVLKTLTERFFADGMAEVIKYGCIKDRALFNTLLDSADIFEIIDEIIYTCVDIKRAVVEADEKDTGMRMLLNFGHTIGHAIEKVYNFEGISHGEAIAIGMHTITRQTEHMGLTDSGSAELIKSLLIKYALPYTLDPQLKDKLTQAASLDKKNLNGKLNLIILSNIGEAVIHPISSTDFIKYL